MESTDKKGKGNFLTDYLRVLAKHKFLVIIPLVVVFLGSIIAGSTLRKVYKATAVFRVLPAAEDERQPIRQSPDDNLKVMKQIMLSRSNLVEVINDVRLDSSYSNFPEGQREVHEDELVKRVRKNLVVLQKANNVFEISYASDDPEMAAEVANSIMSRYIEGILKDEREQMEGTVTYLDGKVKEYDSLVSGSSEALARFIAGHMEASPDSELSDLAALKKILDDLRDAEQKLSDAEAAKEEIEKRIATVEPTVMVTTEKESPGLEELRQKREEAEYRLANLKSMFTDLHPKVVEVNKEIESLDSFIKKAAEKKFVEVKREPNPLLLTLREKLSDAEVQIVAAKGERDQLRGRKLEYEKRVQDVPALQKEMKKLQRKDDLNQEQLRYYTSQLQQAQIELERQKDQGIRFRVLDYARKPSTSAKSSKIKISLLGLVVGGGLGLGLAVLRDRMDTSFKDVGDAASFLDIPIIGTIPVINTATERAREKKRVTLAWMLVGAIVLLLVAALMVTTLTSFPGR